MTRGLLDHARELAVDRERRARHISPERWTAAPAPPATRAQCEDGPRPCPALRCKYHLGEAGDRSFSCELDFVEQAPLDEDGLVPFPLIARVLGVDKSRVIRDVTLAVGKLYTASTSDDEP